MGMLILKGNLGTFYMVWVNNKKIFKVVILSENNNFTKFVWCNCMDAESTVVVSWKSSRFEF